MLLQKDKDSIEAIGHLQKTYRLINEALTGNEAASDKTMATIVVMSQFDRLQGQYRQGVIHLDGLQRMIEMRGGLSWLTREKPNIAQKIFR